mgnify:FL=1
MSLISMISSMSSMVSQIGPGFKAAGTMAINAFKGLMSWFSDNLIKPIREFIDNLSWENIKNTAIDAFTAIMEFTGNFFTTFFDLLPDLPAVFTLDFWSGVFGSIGETITGWKDSLWDALPALPEIFTLQYWTDLFSFDKPDWDAMFTFELPAWLHTTVDFILGNGGFAGFSLSERLDFAFNLPDWLNTTIDFMTGDGVFAGFSIGDRLDLAIGALPQPLSFLQNLFEGLFDISIGDYIDFGIDLVGDAWKFIKKLVDDPVGVFTDVGTSVTTFFTDLGGTLADLLKIPLNFLIGGFNDIIGAISFSKSVTNPFTGTEYTFGLDLSDIKIPELAKGGIVNKPTLAMIGEDGPEAVIPLTQRNNPSGAGMGGGTVNVTVNASGITDRSDKRALAREIGNMIQQEMARNIGGTTMRGRY